MAADDLVSLSGSLALVDDLYQQFLRDPQSLDWTWRELFANGRLPPARPATPPPGEDAAAGHAGNVWALVHAYRARGHLAASLDPLDMLLRPGHPELQPSTYGFGRDDLDRVVPGGGLAGVDRAPLREIVDRLWSTYCGNIGLEFMHITTPAKTAWLAERMEELVDKPPYPAELRREFLRHLIQAEAFERFIHTKFPGTKRFSLEGAETLIPLLDELLEHACRLGSIEAVLGMAHRGRLNVLTHVLDRRPRDLFSEFQDVEPEATLGGGDVKYHLGFSSDRTCRNGQTIHLSLAYNPSHLEAVDPVVCGRVRAKQRRHGDWERRRNLGILIHGDAAFAGQGLVAETLQLSNLHGYRTGGTVHIVVNNQIGFTASPRESRSTPYCTDIAKMIQCPIWHVNGEDLDAVSRVVEMAMEYRAQFQSDVVIDMYCYRKFGHNEVDEPSFTQPFMVERIQKKEPIDVVYGSRLIEQGVISKQEIEDTRQEVKKYFEDELEASRQVERRPVISAMGGVWAPYMGGLERDAPEVETGVPLERLQTISERVNTLPEGLEPHRKVKRLLDQRLEMGRGERPLDWGMAELLAYGTLLWDGYAVRVSGQDSARGTFSHRHALIVDVNSGTEHMLLGHLHPEQGECRIYDSPLSEAGVLGFEFGYSLDYPDALVVWEAQFGDFANGAQVIIDQFITSSEDKWSRLSGLTMYLPHGFEGQGPEHSSARFERFLQLAAEDNLQICQPTTPAQMFHMLRRQVVRPYRKPLVVLTPKSLLRMPAASGRLEQLTSGTFQRVIPDPEPPEKVERVFLCSGRVYYDLVAERERREDRRTAIARLEQIYPWRPKVLAEVLEGYGGAGEVVWVQDEPANMGAGWWLMPRLREIVGSRAVRMVSREESASPATGSMKAHQIEQRELLEEAFGGK